MLQDATGAHFGVVLSVYGLTGCGSLRASCGFCVRPAVRGQCVRCILWLLICGSLAAVDRWQGVRLSWCRSAFLRPLWCVSCSPLLMVCRLSVGSCAGHGGQAVRCPLSLSARCPAPGMRIISAGLLLFMGSLSSLNLSSSVLCLLFMGLLSLFYRSSIRTHIGIIYIIYTILCMMLFIVIQGMMIYSNSMNTQ